MRLAWRRVRFLLIIEGKEAFNIEEKERVDRGWLFRLADAC
jgi:hypothetical protein